MKGNCKCPMGTNTRESGNWITIMVKESTSGPMAIGMTALGKTVRGKAKALFTGKSQSK